MSTVGLNIGILITIFVALGIIIWALIVYFSRDEQDKDNPIGINFMAGTCDGRAIGVEKKVIVGKEGRRITTFSARDVFLTDIKNVEDVVIITDKNKTITLPKGTWSRDRNINIYLPPSADKFPEPLKKTLFGKWMMFLTALTDAENSEIDAFKEGMKRQKGHIKSMGAGEVSSEKMTQLTEYFNEALDAAKESRKDRPSSGFTPIHSPSSGG